MSYKISETLGRPIQNFQKSVLWSRLQGFLFLAQLFLKFGFKIAIRLQNPYFIVLGCFFLKFFEVFFF